MPVAGRLTVDRCTELQTLLDGVGTEVEELAYTLCYFGIAEGEVTGAVRIDEDTDGLGYSDGIGQLYEDFVCYTSCDEVLSYVACCISCRAVHLRGVFAREGTSSMSSFTSVGVDDDFAPRETRISVRTTDDELTCGVYQQLRLTIEGALYLFGIACQDTGKKHTADILGDTCLHRSVGYSLRFGRGIRGLDEVIMLGADDDGVDTLRLAFLGVLYRHLALGIGAKVGHEVKLFLANVSQLFE